MIAQMSQNGKRIPQILVIYSKQCYDVDEERLFLPQKGESALKKSAYVPKEYTPFKYKVPGLRLPSFNDKQLDRKTGKPITVCHPALYRTVGIALGAVSILAAFFLVFSPDSLFHLSLILFLALFVADLLYGLFGNLLFRWEPDPLPDREFCEPKDQNLTIREDPNGRMDK